ncbi:BcpO-related WXXGXW repeat protein [Burkholderia sp. Se-20373]|uniref:YXWGXW repeat-containing protein n=1 Tax=Burkholderia sp. Se-20373 TaxID=2703898 RepID=UPI00197F481C|nr:YXWGXW repeat-containing protein [Burkholderia sp. Se-20373]MBN3745921.1 BcpO-related WXXGXW repeat protein [Burkholderia sp. Se-20373]
MNRRSLLRAIGLTAAFVGTGGWLRAASAQPAPPVYRPSGPNRVPGGPPYPDRPGFAPPAARHDRRPPPPRPHGYIWTDGYWRWQRGRYIWVSGRWVARRPGRRWAPGYWRRQGRVWIYVDGTWR